VPTRKKFPKLSVGRGEKLPASRGAGLTEKGRKKARAAGHNLKHQPSLDLATSPSALAASIGRVSVARQLEGDGDAGEEGLVLQHKPPQETWLESQASWRAGLPYCCCVQAFQENGEALDSAGVIGGNQSSFKDVSSDMGKIHPRCCPNLDAIQTALSAEVIVL